MGNIYSALTSFLCEVQMVKYNVSISNTAYLTKKKIDTAYHDTNFINFS